MISFKGKHSEKEIILTCVRWYLAYALSYRDLEEMMKERGIEVDHTTIYRWVAEYAALLEEEFNKKKKPVGSSWRMDETYIKVKGKWCYLYRAVDKDGNTIDFLLTEKRDKPAATKFFKKAIGSSGVPSKVNIDKSGSNTAALNDINEEIISEGGIPIEIRQNKYLNNLIEQDHRGIKRITKPMMGFCSLASAKITIAGIEIVRMLKKGQNDLSGTPAENFYAIFA